METKEIYKVKTTKGELKYEFVPSWDYGIRMLNAKTVNLYCKLAHDSHPDARECGVFFAFSKEQFKEGYAQLIADGFIKDGDEVCSIGQGSGAYGTRESINKFLNFYEDNNKRIKEECDPQEVYFYEHSNHESQISWKGDTAAIRIIIDTWGEDVARTIRRYNVAYSIDHILGED